MNLASIQMTQHPLGWNESVQRMEVHYRDYLVPPGEKPKAGHFLRPSAVFLQKVERKGYDDKRDAFDVYEFTPDEAEELGKKLIEAALVSRASNPI